MLKLISLFGETYRPAMYMMVHLGISSFTFFLAIPCWHSFIFHTAYLLVLLNVAIWNGGTFYFEVFADKYAASHPKAPKKSISGVDNDQTDKKE